MDMETNLLVKITGIELELASFFLLKKRPDVYKKCCVLFGTINTHKYCKLLDVSMLPVMCNCMKKIFSSINFL